MAHSNIVTVVTMAHATMAATATMSQVTIASMAQSVLYTTVHPTEKCLLHKVTSWP